MKKGEVYVIRNRTLGGKEIEEGEAKLVRKVLDCCVKEDDEAEDWWVEFVGYSDTTYRRRVLHEDKVT